MNKISLVLTIILLAQLNVTMGQNSYIHNRWNIQAEVHKLSEKDKQPVLYGYRLNVNYGFLDFIEAGGYLGAEKYLNFSVPSGTAIRELYAPVYGINVNAHILPLLVHHKNCRFDLYIASKSGGLYWIGNETEFLKGSKFQFFIGGGLAMYPFKNIGAFIEYGHINKDVDNGLNDTPLLFGISYKFRKFSHDKK